MRGVIIAGLMLSLSGFLFLIAFFISQGNGEVVLPSFIAGSLSVWILGYDKIIMYTTRWTNGIMKVLFKANEPDPWYIFIRTVAKDEKSSTGKLETVALMHKEDFLDPKFKGVDDDTPGFLFASREAHPDAREFSEGLNTLSAFPTYFMGKVVPVAAKCILDQREEEAYYPRSLDKSIYYVGKID